MSVKWRVGSGVLTPGNLLRRMLRGRAKTIKKANPFVGWASFENVKKVKRRNKPSSLGVVSPMHPPCLRCAGKVREEILGQLELRSRL